MRVHGREESSYENWRKYVGINERARRSSIDVFFKLCGTGIAQCRLGVSMMSLVRLLGFTTLGCGCVTGRYREVATNREITYVEEKGATCTMQSHRRNHTLAPARAAIHTLTAKAS